MEEEEEEEEEEEKEEEEKGGGRGGGEEKLGKLCEGWKYLDDARCTSYSGTFYGDHRCCREVAIFF